MTSYIISYRKTDAQGRKCWLVWPKAVEASEPEDAIGYVAAEMVDADPDNLDDWNNGPAVLLADGSRLEYFRAEAR